jgi:hypothetical protein
VDSITLPAQPHRVSKLYYRIWDETDVALEIELFGRLEFMVDETLRSSTPWPTWIATTRIDATAYAQAAQEAVLCHQSQLISILPHLSQLPEEYLHRLWGRHSLYRVFSLVNSGREVETDLFAGLREGGRTVNSQQPTINDQ